MIHQHVDFDDGFARPRLVNPIDVVSAYRAAESRHASRGQALKSLVSAYAVDLDLLAQVLSPEPAE